MEKIAQKLRTLIVAEISGTINPEEQAFLNKLRDSSPKVKEYSDWISETLASVDLKEIDDARPPAELILSMAKLKEKRAKVTRRSIAASFAGLIILVSVFYQLRDKAHPETLASPFALLTNGSDTIQLTGREAKVSSSNILSCNGKQINLDSFAASDSKYHLDVPEGSVFTIIETDGSKATLNSASRLAISITPGGRKIDLFTGEGYFTITKNANRIFQIPIPNGNIEVLGTTFNVNTYTTGVSKVSLVEGSIQLTGNNDNIIMKPGTTAVCTGQDIRIYSLDNQDLDWINGSISIDNATARDVEEAVKRYFGRTLEIDPSARDTSQVTIDTRAPVEKFIKNYAKATKHRDTVINGIFYIK